MEFVILGFLLIRDLSQYDLLQALSKEVSPFYQPSLGSIQNGLKKLLASGHITKTLASDTGRKKYLYHISDQGKSYFRQWMVGDINRTKFETEMNTRLFFMGHLDREDRLTIYNKAIDFIRATLEAFNQEHIQAQTYEGQAKYGDIIKYQIKTLDLAIVSYETWKQWLEKQRKELENND